MITMKMKLAGAIIPLANGAVGVTLVPADDGAGGATAATLNLQVLDTDLAGRLSLEDVIEFTIAPAGELRADAWKRENQRDLLETPAPIPDMA